MINFMTVLALTVMAAAAGDAAEISPQTVTACLSGFYGPSDINLARQVTDRILAQAGVRIEWRVAKCPSGALRIKFGWDTPSSLEPRALAHSFPFQGSHIEVFADRIAMRNRSMRPYVLGYVLAHEITHMLQGFDRHSEAGVMKAMWDYNDHSSMRSVKLALTDLDVTLIHDGMARRGQGLKPSNGGRDTLE